MLIVKNIYISVLETKKLWRHIQQALEYQSLPAIYSVLCPHIFWGKTLAPPGIRNVDETPEQFQTCSPLQFDCPINNSDRILYIQKHKKISRTSLLTPFLFSREKCFCISWSHRQIRWPPLTFNIVRIHQIVYSLRYTSMCCPGPFLAFRGNITRFSVGHLVQRAKFGVRSGVFLRSP